MKNKLLALMLVGTFALTGCSLLWGEQTNSDGGNGGNSGEGGGDGQRYCNGNNRLRSVTHRSLPNYCASLFVKSAFATYAELHLGATSVMAENQLVAVVQFLGDV